MIAESGPMISLRLEALFGQSRQPWQAGQGRGLRFGGHAPIG